MAEWIPLSRDSAASPLPAWKSAFAKGCVGAPVPFQEADELPRLGPTFLLGVPIGREPEDRHQGKAGSDGIRTVGTGEARLDGHGTTRKLLCLRRIGLLVRLRQTGQRGRIPTMRDGPSEAADTCRRRFG